MSTFKIKNLIRICSIVTIILWTAGQVFGSKTTWIEPPTGSNVWNLASNWDNGVPTMADSAIITGGSANLNVNILIISTVSALHVQVQAHCNLTILGSGILLVIDAPVHGIRIEENGRLINFGLINTAFTGNGIYVFGSLENYGKCSTNQTNNGIVFAGSSSGINGGEFEIRNSNSGLFCSGTCLMTNTKNGKIDISNCLRGLSNSEMATFTNDSLIQITDCDITGLRNTGTFINNNKIFIQNIGANLSLSDGLVNDSIHYANGNTYIGNFVNNGEIEVAEIKGDAVFNDNSTSFLNKGEIYISTAELNGFTNMPRATFTSAAGSLLEITDVNTSPLDIRLESIFDVAKAAVMEINN